MFEEASIQPSPLVGSVRPENSVEEFNKAVFPCSALNDRCTTLLRHLVEVRSPVMLTFVYVSTFDERVEVRIQTTVIHLTDVFTDGLFDFLARWPVCSCNHVQKVSLEASQFEHLVSNLTIAIIPYC